MTVNFISTTTATGQTPTTTVAAAPLVLTPKDPGIYLSTQIYDPRVPGNTGIIVPQINSIVFDATVVEQNVAYRVVAIDTSTNPPTYYPTYVPILVADSDNGMGLASTVSYGNDRFRAYYDTRVAPYQVTIDQKLFILGDSPRSYRLTRYPNTPNAKVISQYYDASGAAVGNCVPMMRIGTTNLQVIKALALYFTNLDTTNSTILNAWYCAPCRISDQLTDNEELLLEVFSETGGCVATCTLFTKQSAVVNETVLYQSQIVKLVPKSSQMKADGSSYVFVKQSIDALDIYGTIVYADGSTSDVMLNNRQLQCYGREDFISAYSGMQQKLLLKYFASPSEIVSNTGVTDDTTLRSISTEFMVSVVANTLAASTKLSVIPLWNSMTSVYTLRFYAYTSDHKSAIDVTSYVTFSGTAFIGSLFGQIQSLTLSLDMSKVYPSIYSTATTLLQPLTIVLQPAPAYVRWTLQDGVSSPYSYGQDASSDRRPILYYSSTRQQYYIPSDIFINEQAVLASFYQNANPPFDTTTSTSAATPTHFLLRDPNSGLMITAAPQAISDYANAFSIVKDTTGMYVGGTVLMEFVQVISDTEVLTLYGVPVDVRTPPTGSVYLGN